MENITSYGNYARGGTNMVLQNSVFRNVHDPHFYDTGTLVAQGNLYFSTTGQQEIFGHVVFILQPGKLLLVHADADLPGRGAGEALRRPACGAWTLV